jgi:hypothetical protein
VTDVVADEQRLPADAHPPAAGGGVAVMRIIVLVISP